MLIAFLLFPSKTFNATSDKYHANGMKSETYHFRINRNSITNKLDTLRWGPATEWDEDGNKVSELNFRNNLLEGVCQYFYRDGKIRVLYYYRKGKTDSSVWFDQIGNIREKIRAGPERDTIYRYDSSGKINIEARPDPSD